MSLLLEDITTGPINAASTSEEYALLNNLAILYNKTFKTKKSDDAASSATTEDSALKSQRMIAKMTVPISSAGRFQTSDIDVKTSLSQLAKEIPSLNPSSSFYSPTGTSEQYTITGLMQVCCKAQITSASDVEIRLVLVRNATKIPGSIDSVRSKLVIFVNAGSEASLMTALSTLQTYVKVPVHTIKDTATTHKIFVNVFENTPASTHVTSAPHVLSEFNTLHLTQLMFLCSGYAVASEQHAPTSWSSVPELTFPLKSVSPAAGTSSKRKRGADGEVVEIAATETEADVDSETSE